MSYCKQKSCCTDRLSDITFGEKLPVCINVSEWMESVGSRQIVSASWSVLKQSDATADPIVISGESINKGDLSLSAVLEGGAEGEMYEIGVEFETCEGYIGKYCFQQFVRSC